MWASGRNDPGSNVILSSTFATIIDSNFIIGLEILLTMNSPHPIREAFPFNFGAIDHLWQFIWLVDLTSEHYRLWVLEAKNRWEIITCSGGGDVFFRICGVIFWSCQPDKISPPPTSIKWMLPKWDQCGSLIVLGMPEASRHTLIMKFWTFYSKKWAHRIS